MYNIENIKSIHLEVTSKCQAKCPMCPRRMQGGILMPWIDLTEITIDQFKKWFPIDFIKQLNNLNMCGNLGDPIIAKDTVLIYKYLRENNATMNLQMHTNGSARDNQFWKNLAALNVKVVFGIDGLEDTHSKYRIGTDFNKIIENAKTFINAGGEARWDMLVFQHNQHQTDECEKLANELGFVFFQKKNSSRFKDGKYNVLNESGKTIDILYPTKKSKSFVDKIKQSKYDIQPVINCKAKQHNEIYVAANGNVSPCCWLDAEWLPPVSDARIDYMDKIEIYPNLNKNTLDEIFNSTYFTDVEDTWNNDCLETCKKQCGKFDKLGAQYES